MPIKNTKISFGMSAWLKVNGFLNLILLIVLMSLGFAIWRTARSNYRHLFFGYLMTLVFTAMFRVSWTIVGGIMLWDYLYPNMCSSSLNAYLFCTIIVGIVLMLGNCLATKQKSDMEM